MRCVSSIENSPAHLAHITLRTHPGTRDGVGYNRDGICPRAVKPSPAPRAAIVSCCARLGPVGRHRIRRASRSDTLGDCADRRRWLEARFRGPATAARPARTRAARPPGAARGPALPEPGPAVRRHGARGGGPARAALGNRTLQRGVRGPGGARRRHHRRGRRSAAGPHRQRLAGHQRPGEPGHRTAHRAVPAAADGPRRRRGRAQRAHLRRGGRGIRRDPRGGPRRHRPRLRGGVSPGTIPRYRGIIPPNPPLARSRRRSRGPAGD